MLHVKIPNNNIQERCYIIETLFKNFLTLEYQIEITDLKDYTLTFDNKTLIIKDCFFNRFLKPLSYLCNDAIPREVTWDNSHEIPFIYGDDTIEYSPDTIICHADLFASAFFMLSRFEEHILSNKDNFGRFDEDYSLSIQNSFAHIPVVNRYANLLQKLLEELEFIDIVKNEKRFKIVPTHDIDYLYFYNSFSVFFQRFYKCIFKYKNFPQALKETQNYLRVLLHVKKDPYDTFDEIMQLSEKNKFTSYFFFIASNHSKYDQDYNINSSKIKDQIKNILDRGHQVGLHVGYDSFNNKELLSKEFQTMKQLVPELSFSRQHYLRFDMSITPTLLNDIGLKWDSSIGFSKHIGFRSGSCYPYHLFDIHKREKLRIQEKPLVVMDTALASIANISSIENAKTQFFELVKNVKQEDGEFIILWHNSSFHMDKWPEIAEIYKEFISTISPYSS
jgi:hypothetical protein